MDNETFTTAEIAKAMHVSSMSVVRWINDKKLKSFKTPGGHRRVERKELIRFLEAHEFPIPVKIRRKNTVSIVVVDDDKRVLNLIRRMFTRKNDNFEVSTVQDVFDAGYIFGDKKPELVILDIFIPGINGFQMCKRMKTLIPKTKIILITGKPEKINKRKVKESGADAIFYKPFKLDELRSTMLQLLNS